MCVSSSWRDALCAVAASTIPQQQANKQNAFGNDNNNKSQQHTNQKQQHENNDKYEVWFQKLAANFECSTLISTCYF